jgi:glycosyltransferase involved in cell wall biosynthesis
MAKEGSAQPLISIVIPAYNEEANVSRGALQEVIDHLQQQPYQSEIIVVDDGSEDATAERVEETASSWPFLTLLRTDHGGKPHAVRAGVQAARGRFVLFTDMDQSTPIGFVDNVLHQLQAGQDIVVGSRWLKGAARLGGPWSRRLLGRAFALLVRLFLLSRISDSQCGFKGFRREVAADLFARLLVFRRGVNAVRGPAVTAFDVELLLLARKRGYQIAEIPVRWHHGPTSRVNALRDASRMFWQAARVWLNNLRGKYDTDKVR